MYGTIVVQNKLLKETKLLLFWKNSLLLFNAVRFQLTILPYHTVCIHNNQALPHHQYSMYLWLFWTSLERIIIILKCCFSNQGYSLKISVVFYFLYHYFYTKGVGKRSVFNSVGNGCSTQEPLDSFGYFVATLAFISGISGLYQKKYWNTAFVFTYRSWTFFSDMPYL